MNGSGIIGFALLVLVIGAATSLSGGAAVFVNLPSIIFCVAVAIGLELMTYGLKPFVRALAALRVLVVKPRPGTLDRSDAEVLRGFARHLYIAGGLGTMIGLITMLASLDDPAQLGRGIAVALRAVFSALLVAEGLLRPCAHRIEFLLGQETRAGRREEQQVG